MEQIVIQRAFRYRLHPTVEQAERLSQFVGATRFVYNLCLEQRTTYGRRGRSFSYIKQSREITELRSEVDWINAVPRGALTQALRDLDKAFAAFFAGRARYPTPRVKGRNDSFRIQAHNARLRRLNKRWAEVHIPNLGWIKLRNSRELRGDNINLTVSRSALGWFASFACSIDHEAAPSVLPAVGIDRGVANTIALSTGELLSTPATTSLERRRKRAQRVLARRARGSKRYAKQRRKVARLAAKIARVRNDWRHKVTTDIAHRFGAVAIEDLNTKGMLKANRGLARSISEQGWRAFETTLGYKLEERGGTLVKIHPAYTSQQCSACGTIDKASRESQSSFACRHCGFAAHADTNAAINILRRSTPAQPVEASGYGAIEAGTINRALAA